MIRELQPPFRRGLLALVAVTCAAMTAGLTGAGPAMAVLGASHPAVAITPGTQLWERNYNGPGNGEDQATSVVVSPGGGLVFVTGSSSAGARFGDDDDYATVAYSVSSGLQVWASRYDGPDGLENNATALAVSPDGSTVFVTGNSAGSGTGQDFATIAYNAKTGAQLWVSRYNGQVHGTGTDQATAVAVSQDGSTVYVTGNSAGAHRSYQYATIAYNAATGAQRWVSRYQDSTSKTDFPVAISAGPGGGMVFVTGASESTSSDSSTYLTVAYSAATGAREWASRYAGPAGRGLAHALAVGAGGRTVFVTGTSVASRSAGDYATVAYNAGTGAQRWVSRYNGPANRSDQAHSVSVGAGGRTVFVTGSSWGARSSYDYATVAYNTATGAQRWVSRYNGPGNRDDNARVVVAGAGGQSIFVTGASMSGHGHLNYATVAYSAVTGAQQWVSIFNDPSGGDDFASAMAVGQHGSAVFVTGTAGGRYPFAGGDYGTILYKN